MTVANIVAQLAAAGVPRAYGENQVPASPAYPYAVVSLSSSTPAAKTVDGHAHVVRWLMVRLFAKTGDSLIAAISATDAAFNGRTLPLPGSPVAEFLQASQTSRDADDGGVLGTVLIYRY